MKSPLLPVLVLALALPFPALAQAPGVLTGMVTEAGGGTPLVAAAVEIDSLQLRAITNSQGEFTLGGIPDGTHLVRIHAFGYQELRVTVTFPRSFPLRVTVDVDPILLDGLDAVGRRLQTAEEAVAARRRASPYGATYVSPERIQSSAGRVSDILQSLGPALAPCPPPADPEAVCVRGRGGAVTTAQMCIDERRAWGGLIELDSYPKEEIHSMEYYGQTGHIRVYTIRFMQMVAVGREPIRAFPFC